MINRFNLYYVMYRERLRKKKAKSKREKESNDALAKSDPVKLDSTSNLLNEMESVLSMSQSTQLAKPNVKRPEARKKKKM